MWKKPQNNIGLHPDTDDGDFYVLTPDPLKREAPQMFKPTQIKNDANFLPYQIRKAHHITFQKFLKYKEPENYLFFKSKYTSPFTLNSDYLIDHTKIKGKL